MSFKINDPVFSSVGEPGVIRKIDPHSQKITVDRDEKTVREEFRHGYIRSLGVTQRSTFNEFMDEVKNEPVPKQKVEMLQNKIKELEQNFSPDNHSLMKYLKSELAHIMNTYHVQPREFEAREDSIY